VPPTPCAIAGSVGTQSFELAIAIPTYNRSAQLASLLAQLTGETLGSFKSSKISCMVSMT
jgi:hypothetical protein